MNQSNNENENIEKPEVKGESGLTTLSAMLVVLAVAGVIGFNQVGNVRQSMNAEKIRVLNRSLSKQNISVLTVMQKLTEIDRANVAIVDGNEIGWPAIYPDPYLAKEPKLRPITANFGSYTDNLPGVDGGKNENCKKKKRVPSRIGGTKGCTGSSSSSSSSSSGKVKKRKEGSAPPPPPPPPTRRKIITGSKSLNLSGSGTGKPGVWDYNPSNELYTIWTPKEGTTNSGYDSVFSSKGSNTLNKVATKVESLGFNYSTDSPLLITSVLVEMTSQPDQNSVGKEIKTKAQIPILPPVQGEFLEPSCKVIVGHPKEGRSGTITSISVKGWGVIPGGRVYPFGSTIEFGSVFDNVKLSWKDAHSSSLSITGTEVSLYNKSHVATGAPGWHFIEAQIYDVAGNPIDCDNDGFEILPPPPPPCTSSCGSSSSKSKSKKSKKKKSKKKKKKKSKKKSSSSSSSSSGCTKSSPCRPPQCSGGKGCKTGNRKKGKDGCFKKSTKVLMADGSTKRIDNLTVTDVIWNPILKTPVLIKRVIKGEENLPLIEVGTSMKKVSVTEGHPFITKNGTIAAKDLRLGDEILTTTGDFRPVSHWEILPANEDEIVWNIELYKNSDNSRFDHAIVADGVLTGDLYLQQKLIKMEQKE